MLQLDNIMELAKIDEGDFSIIAAPHTLKDIVKSSIQPIISTAVKKDISLSIDYDFDLPDIIHTDGRVLRLVLTNLLRCSVQFAEHGKVVLNIQKIPAIDDGINEGDKFKLRFAMENSHMLHEALYGVSDYYKNQDNQDLREFGEITVALITTQQLLNALGAPISFDTDNGHEPPFHFDIDLVDRNPAAVKQPSSAYQLIQNKRALVYQDDILALSTLVQSLRLWDIDYRVIDDHHDILEEIDIGHREGKDYDFIFFRERIEGAQLAQLKEKVPHLIMVTNDPTLNKAWLDEFSAHLHPPLYPDELLSTLANLYGDSPIEQEQSLTETASLLLETNSYEPVKAHVLLVEDDLVSRMYAAELLESMGCTVTTAENGYAALNRFDKHSEDYDIIFMDCMMPRMDGYAATKELRQNGESSIPIIALTANTLEKDREKCLAAGMSDYISKPVKEQDLHEMLKKHL